MSEKPTTAEPSWKTEYPVKQSEEHKASRRTFAKTLCIGCAAAAGALLLKNKLLNFDFSSAKPIVVAQVGELEIGASKLFAYPTPDYPCILIRLEADKYVAYSQNCTHLMCPVHFQKETAQLVCPCHNGYFNAQDGSVIAGPPPRALPSFPVAIRDGSIFVG